MELQFGAAATWAKRQRACEANASELSQRAVQKTGSQVKQGSGVPDYLIACISGKSIARCVCQALSQARRAPSSSCMQLGRLAPMGANWCIMYWVPHVPCSFARSELAEGLFELF